MAERPELWELRVAVVATTTQADELMDRIAGLLGPDAVPWSVAQVPGWQLDPGRRAAYADLGEDGERHAAHDRRAPGPAERAGRGP